MPAAYVSPHRNSNKRRANMIPSNIHPTWYDTYWYGVPEIRRRYWHGAPRWDVSRRPRIEPAVLAAGLLFAALVIGAAALALFGPAVPADGLYFVT
jgi:hypothetical protein